LTIIHQQQSNHLRPCASRIHGVFFTDFWFSLMNHEPLGTYLPYSHWNNAPTFVAFFRNVSPANVGVRQFMKHVLVEFKKIHLKDDFKDIPKHFMCDDIYHAIEKFEYVKTKMHINPIWTIFIGDSFVINLFHVTTILPFTQRLMKVCVFV